MNGFFDERLHEIGPGDHVCLVYDDPEEQVAAVVPYVKLGLERHERCFYVADDRTVEEVRRSLQGAGVEVDAETDRGSLSLVTKRDAYLRFGRFDPDEMVRFVGQSTEKARADGFSALRITGEMTWALGPEVGCERLIEYEVALNNYFPGSNALAICQYHRQRFSPSVIRDVLRTHPVAILGSLICSNVYYEPPDIIMRGGDDARKVEWMVQQLKSVREAEEKLIHQAQELARSNADLEQFAYVASHDLREPLRIMTIYSQILGKKYKGRLDSDTDRTIDFIIEGAQRMEALVHDLLAFSAVSSREETSSSRTVDMNKAAALSMLNLRVLIDETGARVTHDNLPTIPGNETQLVQVLQNLIENGIKFRKEDDAPRVHITGRPDGKSVVFSVRDNGIGISPAYQGQIFGIFKRLGRQVAGTGIGLAICQRIVQKHRGQIWVESELGSGSTFYFSIPRQ